MQEFDATTIFHAAEDPDQSLVQGALADGLSNQVLFAVTTLEVVAGSARLFREGFGVVDELLGFAFQQG
jgi:hypothetical protein